MSETTTPMGIEMTEDEKTKLIYSRKIKDYEADEAFIALADYGLRDALNANPEVIVNDNAVAYKMMVDNAKQRMEVETAKKEPVVDESQKLVEPNAPLIPKQQPSTVDDGSKVDITGMDIYDAEKMKKVDVDPATAMFIAITSATVKNDYGI